jgi:methylation protein EvaC
MLPCRVCATIIEPFMTFGKMPIANGFLLEADLHDEYFFEMEVAFCETCGTFQLVEQPNAKLMFHENYAFFQAFQKICRFTLKNLPNKSNYTYHENSNY